MKTALKAATKWYKNFLILMKNVVCEKRHQNVTGESVLVYAHTHTHTHNAFQRMHAGIPRIPAHIYKGTLNHLYLQLLGNLQPLKAI